MSVNRKCIVLDLDNTLWGGIVGEDGLKGIKLGPTSEGRPFWEFQKYLFSLFKQGIVLAINSKNNYDEVLTVFRKHPYMVLKEEHFAAMQINWNDKVSNLKTIANEINIGPDSLIFIDDDKLNREIIKNTFPEVSVVDMPDDPSLYLSTIMDINDICTLQITEEDKKKGKMYAEQRKRNDFKKVVVDLDEYLKALKIVLTIEKSNSFSTPRISQLTKKTNQFNMTTRRYEEEDIRKMASDKNFLVYSAQVEDRFGDNGITGVVIIEKTKTRWRIDTFLLSCRVLGRRIEDSLFALILSAAKNEKVSVIVGEFTATKKNIPAKDFFKNHGFHLFQKENAVENWEYDVAKKFPSPAFIKIVNRD